MASRMQWWSVAVGLALTMAFAGAEAIRAEEPPSSAGKDPYASTRERMVQRCLIERGIKDPKILDVFRELPRHKFLPKGSVLSAYEDKSVPIGKGQTMTAPFEQAFMTEALHLKPTDRVYEVGTGSGVQAAILSRLCKEVYTVEIHEELSQRASQVFRDLGYTNIHARAGDGYAGWPEAAPFDAVIVTCSPELIPPPLVQQLKEGGRMIIPVANPKDRHDQKIYLFEKKGGQMVLVEQLRPRPTLFVPMTGQAQKEAEAARKRAETKTQGARLKERRRADNED